MQKNSYKTHWNVKTLVFMALLVAMHLVLTRVFVIELGPYRIAIGSVCTILAGMWMGPAAGAACGLAADLIGCFIKGYALDPFITFAAMLWGIIPALMKPLYVNKTKAGKTVGIVISVVITAILSSLIFTTIGLVIFEGYGFYTILPGRLVQFVILIPVYCVLVCILYFSPITNMVVSSVSPRTLQKKTV